jgi:hypothetical protein
MNGQAFLWLLPVFGAAVLALQVRHGRIPLYWTPKGWRVVEKASDEGRFWLFIVAEGFLVFILIGQALSA